MNKTIIRLVFIVPTVIGFLVLVSVLAFNAVREVIIDDNEALVHSVAQSLLPALLVNDAQQVDALMKALESHPGIQSAELISSQGASIASYSRKGQSFDPAVSTFELASSEADLNQLYVMAPITFDSLIVANLHIAVNLWPTYLRIMIWLGFLLIVPSVVYVLIRHFRVKLRFEILGQSNGSGPSGDSFDLDDSLSTAMADADISLEFQPIQRMSDAGIFGMEVVVCWRHPSGQTLHIPPSDFVSLAERYGICLPFDDWVLKCACAKAAMWQHKHGPLVLTVNISAKQFEDPAFAKKVRTICEHVHFPHQLLELEVHESLINNQPQQVASNIGALMEQGLSINVDNFGLAKESLNLLEVLPVSKIKLDAKLVKRIESDKQIADLVQQIISRALLNDVQVMVDGVSSKSQQERLQRMGCILGQGPYFSHALTENDFEACLISCAFNVLNNSYIKSDRFGMSDDRNLSAI